MKRQHGFTLVELLIGLTIGLLMVAAASTLMLSQLKDHQRLRLETQAQQEMRAIGELLRRELSQAGAWAEPERGLWQSGAPMANPYTLISLAPSGSSLQFTTSQAALEGSGENSQADAVDTKAFRLKGQVLEFMTDGGSYQPLNDPNSLAITGFQVSVQDVPHSEEALCPQPCKGLTECPPTVTTRRARVQLAGHAAADPQVQLALDFHTRIRAGLRSGQCRA